MPPTSTSCSRPKTSCRRDGPTPISDPDKPPARPRLEMDLDKYKSWETHESLGFEKATFAQSFIIEEHEAFGNQAVSEDEGEFENATRDHLSRIRNSSYILRGMFVRGRLQAAVFRTFIELCRQGACSLRSLKHAIDWDWVSGIAPGTSVWKIAFMLQEVTLVKNDLLLENSPINWQQYNVPRYWLAVMIARSFTNLESVFQIIQNTKQLGSVNMDAVMELIGKHQDACSDVNLNRSGSWSGSGTIACWLPENIERRLIAQSFEVACKQLEERFFGKVRNMEAQCFRYFDIADVEE